MSNVNIQIKTNKKGKKTPYYIYEDSKGKVISQIKIAKSGYTINEARDIIKKKGTFQKDVFRVSSDLDYVREISLYKMSPVTEGKYKFKSPIFPRNKKVTRAYAGVQLDDGTVLYANSKTLGSPGAETKEKAQKQAMENLYKRIDQYYTTDYDVEEGKTFFKNQAVKVYHGWRYFEAR